MRQSVIIRRVKVSIYNRYIYMFELSVKMTCFLGCPGMFLTGLVRYTCPLYYNVKFLKKFLTIYYDAF